MKPWVKKFGHCWVWRCPLHEGEKPGEDYHHGVTRDPWAVAYHRARQHAEGYHGGTILEDVA